VVGEPGRDTPLPERANFQVRAYSLDLPSPFAPYRFVTAVNFKLIDKRGGQKVGFDGCDSEILPALGTGYIGGS